MWMAAAASASSMGAAEFDAEASVAAYAQGLREVMSGFDAHLLLEPGRFLVAQAGVLLTRVLYTKQNGSKRFVITDAAMNDLIRPALYGAHHEIVPVAKPGSVTMVADIVGPVCESGDFFARGRELPELVAGDLVALLDAGAYGMSLSSQYKHARPAGGGAGGERRWTAHPAAGDDGGPAGTGDGLAVSSRHYVSSSVLK